MASHHFAFLFFLLFLLFDSNIFHSFVQAENDDTDLLERADYYLKGLKKTLVHLKSSQNVRYRRDTINGKDRILSSLANLCLELKSELEDVAATTTLPPPKQEPTILYDGKDHPSMWAKPALSLLSVEAERVGNRVNITFKLNHMSQAFAIRLHTLDKYSALIGSPGRYDDLKTSELHLTIDGSKCEELLRYGRSQEATFIFSLVGDDRYNSKISFDVCHFDKVWQRSSEESSNEKLVTREDKKVFLENIKLPRFRVVSHNEDIIFIDPGQNTQLDMDIEDIPEATIYIRFTSYDWVEERFQTYEIELRNNYYHDFGSVDNENVLRFEIVGRTSLNDTDNEETHGSGINTQMVIFRIRVNVTTGSKKISGKLMLMPTMTKLSDRGFVKFARSQKMILMKLPYKFSALPRNKIDEVFGGDLQCKEHEQPSQNCSIFCYADGTDIQSILIIKSHPYRPPVRSNSYVLYDGGESYVQNDLGPVSKDIEGLYRCVVIFKNADIRIENITILATGFTKVHSLLVDDFGNGTTHVMCSVSGYGHVNISLRVLDDNFKTKQLDLEVENHLTLDKDEKMTNLTLLLSTYQLLYPQTALECLGEGERGIESRRVSLPEVIAHHDPRKPKIQRDELRVLNNTDSATISIECSAYSSKSSYELLITREQIGKTYRIDYNDGNVRKVTEKIGGKTIKLTMPNKSLLDSASQLYYCGAIGYYGRDWFPFYLNETSSDVINLT